MVCSGRSPAHNLLTWCYRLPAFPEDPVLLKDLSHILCPDCYKEALANYPLLVKHVLWDDRLLGAHFGRIP